jgi:hypothetical protein
MTDFEGRPNPDLAPAYAQYYFDRTIGQTNLLHALEFNKTQVLEFLSTFPVDKADFQYADDKWSVKGVLLHTIETERILQYRALRISRKDKTPIEGFDEDRYVQFNLHERRSIADLSAEFESVRNASISLFRYMNAHMLDFEGVANNHPITPRNIAWFIIGHTMHHCDIIKERYLVELED